MRAQDQRSIGRNRIAVLSRMDGARMWIFLPGIGHFHAMAEEALIAGDVTRNLCGERAGQKTD